MRIKPSLRKASRLVALGAVAAMAFASMPSSAVAASQSVDITGSQEINECTQETVTLSGRLHIVANATTNPDGSTTIVTHLNTQGVTGIGNSTGFEYVFNQGTTSVAEVTIPAGGIGHIVHHTEFIHPGEFGGVPNPAEDDKHTHFHTTVAVDADGVPIIVPVPQHECR